MYIYDSHRADKSARYIQDEPLGLHIDSITVATAQGKVGVLTHWEVSYHDMLCSEGDTQEELVHFLQTLPKRLHLDYEKPHYYARALAAFKRADKKADKAEQMHADNAIELRQKALTKKQEADEAFEREKHAQGTAKSILIYTDNVDKAYGFLQNFCELKNDIEFVKLSFDFSVHIEIRTITPFIKSVDDIRASLGDQTGSISQVIAAYMFRLYQEIFLPEKQFFITPGKRTREHIQKKQKHYKDFTALKVFPKTYLRYQQQLQAYFGGIGLAEYQDCDIDADLILLDIKSSHPYELFTSPHAIDVIREGSYRGKTDLQSIKIYAQTVMSIGLYDITFENAPIWLKQWSTVIDNKGKRHTTSLSPEKTTARYCFCNIDLLTFIESFEQSDGIIHEVKPIQVTEFKVGNMPQYMREVIFDEYCKKHDLDCLKHTPDEWKRDQQKVVLNGIGGSCAKKISRTSYGREMKKSRSAPVWAIFMAAYGRRSVVELGMQLEGWIYSDTDSIICKDCPENLEKIENFNIKRQEALKKACKKSKLDYNRLKGLGSFELEKHITKIRINGFKQYGYISLEDPEPTIKAAGLAEELKKDFDYNKFFDHGELPFGSYPAKVINSNKVTLTIDDVEIVSDGFYYEDKIDFNDDMHTLIEKLRRSKRSHF